MSSVEEKTGFIQAFRQSSPYIHAHRKKTFVILIDGEAIASQYLPSIVYDIALLNTLGIRVIVSYGTRHQINQSFVEQGIEPVFKLGKRVTSQEDLEQIKRISGQCRFELEARFSNTLPNTPMHGARIRTISGNFISAKPLGVLDGQDFQFTGGIRKVDTEAIHPILDAGDIVLLSNIGYSPTGECFNMAAEEVAVAAAEALQADKLIIYANKHDCSKLPRELMPGQARSLLGDSSKHALECMINACDAGIKRCHMISFETDGALLLELFTTDGCGTLLSKTSFESIRPAKIKDVGGILTLLEPLEEKGILVKRDRELLEQEIGHFIVIERDGMIIACSALYPFDNTMGEIACVVTHPDYQGNQRGATMLDYLEKQAQQQAMENVFVLTTQTAHFFLQQGFTEMSIDDLPEGKKSLYNYQRNAKVFTKKLR